MSTFLTEQEWIDKKISEGYFGFQVCELDKIYSKEEIDKLEKFFKYNTDCIDKEATSDIKRLVAGEHLPLKNGRRSNDSLLKWFKEMIQHNKDEDGNRFVEEPIRRYISRLDLDALCNFNVYDKTGGEAMVKPDPEKPVRYSYEFVKLFYWYLHESTYSDSTNDIHKIPGMSDLTLSIEPTLFNFYRPNTENFESFKKQINKISKDAIRYLYNEDIDNYLLLQRHINLMPEFSLMGNHTDDTNFDSRDFTILIYMNPTWLDYNEGKLRYHIPRISIDGGSDKLEQAYTYSKHHYHDILPVFTNVVVMNHMNNDNIGALIRHEVTKTLHTENRYAVYSTYRKK